MGGFRVCGGARTARFLELFPFFPLSTDIRTLILGATSEFFFLLTESIGLQKDTGDYNTVWTRA